VIELMALRWARCFHEEKSVRWKLAGRQDLSRTNHVISKAQLKQRWKTWSSIDCNDGCEEN